MKNRAFDLKINFKNSAFKNVQLWLINLSNLTLDEVEEHKKFLSEAEKKRANSFLNLHHQGTFIVTRSIVKQLLSLYLKRPVLEFLYSTNGKPLLDGIHFNISHSKNIGLLGINNSPIGVDVEFIEKSKLIFEGAASFLDEPEKIWVGHSYNRLYQLWTLKEAILKCEGTGLTDHFPSINTAGSMSRYKRLHLFNSNLDNYSLSFAVR